MAKKHLVIDPITRIEGHLRIEAIIDENNVVVDAFSSSTMFRGIETILKGRDPRDCGLLAMRICGVCTGTHYQRSIEAVEHAFEITIPKNARLVRNLIQGALYLHDHIVHFYHLHALDWVDITKALEADPKKTVIEVENETIFFITYNSLFQPSETDYYTYTMKCKYSIEQKEHLTFEYTLVIELPDKFQSYIKEEALKRTIKVWGQS